MQNTINSVFIATELRSGKRSQVKMTGAGQETAVALRKQFPRLTIFVLQGFEINGNFVPLSLTK